MTDASAPTQEAADDFAFLRAIAVCAAERGPIMLHPQTAKDMVIVIDRLATCAAEQSTAVEAMRRKTLGEAAGVVGAHRYEDEFLNTCTIRRSLKLDLITAIRALIDTPGETK